MAELVGLAASIVQLGGAGTELSKALYNFVSSAARADTEIKDLAGDVKLTCRALDRVGDTLRTEARSSGSMLKREAIDEAEEIKLRCESIFTEISEIFERRWIRDKDGKRILSILGKVAWPLKEQKVELLRRRLESLKLSLLLLLNVLQLAHEQARGYDSPSLTCSLILIFRKLIDLTESLLPTLRRNVKQFEVYTGRKRWRSNVSMIWKKNFANSSSADRTIRLHQSQTQAS